MIVVYTDLDNTVFQTARRDPSGTVPASMGKDGKVVSLMTAGQASFFGMFGGGATVVAVTARNADAFMRIRPEIFGKTGIRTAICSMGRTLMVDKGHPGKPQWTRDSDWDREMSFIVPGETELGQVAGLAASLAPRSAETSVVSCQGNPVYVKVVFRDEDPERSDRAASELRRSAEPPKGFRIGGYGSEVLFLPAGVSKEMAVKRLMEGRFKGADLTVGAGDSGDDLGFMEMCDYNIIPKNTNIWRKTHA